MWDGVKSINKSKKEYQTFSSACLALWLAALYFSFYKQETQKKKVLFSTIINRGKQSNIKTEQRNKKWNYKILGTENPLGSVSWCHEIRHGFFCSPSSRRLWREPKESFDRGFVCLMPILPNNAIYIRVNCISPELSLLPANFQLWRFIVLDLFCGNQPHSLH